MLDSPDPNSSAAAVRGKERIGGPVLPVFEVVTIAAAPDSQGSDLIMGDIGLLFHA
jgi:hypothetical protein